MLHFCASRVWGNTEWHLCFLVRRAFGRLYLEGGVDRKESLSTWKKGLIWMKKFVYIMLFMHILKVYGIWCVYVCFSWCMSVFIRGWGTVYLCIFMKIWLYIYLFIINFFLIIFYLFVGVMSVWVYVRDRERVKMLWCYLVPTDDLFIFFLF